MLTHRLQVPGDHAFELVMVQQHVNIADLFTLERVPAVADLFGHR